MVNFQRRLMAALGGIVALVSAQTAAQGLNGTGQPAGPPSDVRSTGVASRAAACTLHVWPAGPARSSFMGWFHGGAVDGDKRGIKGYPAMHSEVLSTTVQQQLLTQIDWPNILDRPGLAVVVHEQPPESQDDRARTTALIADRPACYGELLVHSVLVERQALSTNTVRVMIIAKTWSGVGMTPRNFTAMANAEVTLDGQDNQAVETSLKNGFVTSITKLLNSGHFATTLK